MELQSAKDTMRHPVDRTERTIRVLKNHGYTAAIRQLLRARAHRAQRPAAEVDLPAGRPVHARDQSSDGALAAAAFAYKSHDLLLADRQVDVVDGMQDAVGEVAAKTEMLGEAGGLEQRGGVSVHRS